MIVKKTYSEQIYESIKTDILKQKIGFGEKLVNRELQERFGVSSTPVRDAINRLYQDGLVEDITKSGARVVTFDLKSALEVNEVVSMINVSALEMSSKRANPEVVIEALEECLRKQRQNVNNVREYMHYDYEFHKTFFEYCDNSRFLQMYRQYHTLWEILVTFYYTDKERTKANSISQHQKIIDAYKSGNIALAQHCMVLHFDEAIRPLTRAMDKPNPQEDAQ